MPTIVKEMEEDEDLLGSPSAWLAMHREKYLFGMCYAFALALHEGLGWPIIGIAQLNVIEHAGVRTPEGLYMDIRGPLSASVFVRPYHKHGEYALRELTADDLQRQNQVPRSAINAARYIAQKIFPDLPWYDQYERIRQFANELEELSRKHSFWIRGGTPGTLPFVYEAYGEEEGYTVIPHPDFQSYQLTRRLPNED